MHALKSSQALLLTKEWKYIFVDYIQEMFQVCQRVTSSRRSTTRLGLKYHYEIYQNLKKKTCLLLCLLVVLSSYFQCKHMLYGCKLIDTEHISLLSKDMKFVVEWAKRTSRKHHILSSTLTCFSINHIHIQMTCLSSLNQT